MSDFLDAMSTTDELRPTTPVSDVPSSPEPTSEFLKAVKPDMAAEPLTGSATRTTKRSPFLEAIFGTEPGQQATILPEPEQVTQRFGNYNPAVEVMSRGTALGTNITARPGTPVAVPPGNWQVENTFTTAKRGYIGDAENSGYGNAVKVRNTATGEVLHFTHLSNVSVMPGQLIMGNSVIGNTGATGNVTGPHLNLEYYTPQGQLGDVLTSPYGRYIPLR